MISNKFTCVCVCLSSGISSIFGKFSLSFPIFCIIINVIYVLNLNFLNESGDPITLHLTRQPSNFIFWSLYFPFPLRKLVFITNGEEFYKSLNKDSPEEMLLYFIWTNFWSLIFQVRPNWTILYLYAVSIHIVNKGDWRGPGDMGTMPEVTQGWSWALQWKKIKKYLEEWPPGNTTWCWQFFNSSTPVWAKLNG